MSERLDDARLAELVLAVATGEVGSWEHLISLIHPHLERIVATSSSMGPLGTSEDHRRAVATDVLAKLARNNFRALSLLDPWLAAHPGKTSGDWLRIVVANVIREYVARQLGSDATKRLLHTLAGALPAEDTQGLRPPMTNQQTAREVLDYAAAHLPPDQLRALDAWLRQLDFAEVGRSAGVADDPARGGERLVRAALATLRRHFAD